VTPGWHSGPRGAAQAPAAHRERRHPQRLALPVRRAHRFAVCAAGGERKPARDEGTPMHHNANPPVPVSALPPGRVDLRPDLPPMAACPVCGRWRLLRQRREPKPVRLEAGAVGLLSPHRASDGRDRCPGSGQRIVIDLTVLQWAVRLDAAIRHAATRHGSDLIYQRTRLRFPPAA
jgi:hypothetical protein